MIYELPLFPLHTVLFPGMPLTLHIFEERYKRLIQECLQRGEPFGVVLIKEGVEALGPLAQPHDIGCTAEIAQVQGLDDGSMNIIALGRQRFQIRTLYYDQPYLRAAVEHFPLDVQPARKTDSAGKRLLPWLEEYLILLSTAGEVQFDLSSLPDDPETLAYLAAAVLQIPNAQKQSLLATAAAGTMFTDMRELYRRELPVLRVLVQEDEAAPMEYTPFSMN